MKFSLKKRGYSGSDYSYHLSHKLGVAPLPSELLFLSQILDQGSVDECTSYSGVATRYNELNTTFDPALFWNQEVAFAGNNGATGFDIEVPAATAVELGFPNGNPKSYFWISPNNGQDLFDSVRTCMFQQNRPLTGGMMWMDEYTDTPLGEIVSIGQTPLGGHCIKIAGWQTMDSGITYMVLQNSWGTSVGTNGLYYMPREVFNSAFNGYGIFLWSDDPNAYIAQLGWFQALCQNVISLMQSLIKQKNGTYPPVAPLPSNPVSQIPNLADGIFEAEGNGKQAGMKYNNRGDLKFTGYTKSLGATGAGENNFAIFPTMAIGDQACVQLCTDVAHNLLLGYPKPCTIQEFVKVYGEPSTQKAWDDYVAILCAHTGKTPTTLLSDLL